MTRPDQTRPDQTRPDHSCRKNPRRKILLVTLYGNFNYGNILQRCSISRVIEELGFYVQHLCSIGIPSVRKRTIRKLKRIVKRILAFAGVEKYRKQFREEPTGRKVTEAFENFQGKYVTQRTYMTIKQALAAPQTQWTEYDYAVTGSDQVWHNWNNKPEELEYYYLSFMPAEKRVNYAPSFGFSEFSPDDFELHRKGLAGFKRISCREQEMIPMIKQASGKDAQLVLDPTLLLKPETWRSYAQKPDYDVPEKFVLCYFLGTKPLEYRDAIRQCSGDMPVISLLDQEDMTHRITGPGGFLWLIDHADFVCTDSFHGTAFSVNFGKNFLAFRRDNTNAMFGRISGLLDSLSIAGHIYCDGMKLRPEVVDYGSAYAKLDALRESSMNYLRECLQ